MIDKAQIHEHMEIKGSDGKHVGTVDRVEGDRIRLTKFNWATGDEHHYIDVGVVDDIKDDAVRLNRTAHETERTWH